MGYKIINGESNASLLITVEHASSKWPESEADPGLQSDWQDQAYAYDRGAALLAESIAKEINCCVILGEYSRILVDLNRVPGDPDIVSDRLAGIDEGKKIPGNVNLSNRQRDDRIKQYYVPYHDKIRDVMQLKNIKRYISIHSYSSIDTNDGSTHPWKLGIQYPIETDMVKSALTFFRNLHGDEIGDNCPYDLRELSPGAISLHAAPYGIDNIELEFRDDQLIDPKSRDQWGRDVISWINCFYNA